MIKEQNKEEISLQDHGNLLSYPALNLLFQHCERRSILYFYSDQIKQDNIYLSNEYTHDGAVINAHPRGLSVCHEFKTCRGVASVFNLALAESEE